ncbi:MAG TPA: tetratricopeptide repeat protein [Bryobacteraceae bacterium]|nr:tetratricopeptide repeat protein [Bryobacteraceae bacterium]
MRRIGVFALLVLAAGCGKSPRQYVDAGDRFLAAHKYADASINYRNAIQKDSRFAEAYYGLGKSYLAQGKAREAYAAFARTVELAPQNMDAKRQLANLALAGYLADRRRPKNLYDQLNKLAADFLSRDPNSYDGLRLKAYITLNDNQRAEALGYFRKALQVKPWDPEMAVMLGQVLMQEDATAHEGEKLILDLIQQHQDAGAAYDTLYRYYANAKRQREAEDILKRKVAANPKQAGYILQLAEYYRRAGNIPEMKATLATILNDAKTFPKALMITGDFYNQTGDREQALKYYEQGAQTAGDDQLTYQKRQAATLTALGRADQALSVLDAALRAHAKDSELHMARALILLSQGKADPALAELQQQDQEHRDNAAVKYQLGRALLLKGKGPEATAAWQESAKLQPGYAEPKLALATYALQNRQYEEAQRWADQTLAGSPGNVTAQIIRADALQGLGRIEEAKTLLSNLRRQMPGNATIDMEYALLSLRDKNPAEAEKIFRAYYTPGQENLRPLNGLVEALFVQKRGEEAVSLIKADLAKAPGRPAVEMLLANSLAVSGQTATAIQALDRLAAAHPDLPGVRMRLGQLHGVEGNMDAALASFQKARELAPKSADPLLAIAEVEERVGRTDAARQDYQAALKLDAANPVALNNLAFLTADSGGNLDDALRMITTASQKFPKQPNLSDTLGYVYLKQKKVSSALRVFGDLTQQYPRNPTFLFHHALALLESGSKEQARKELEAALAAKPPADLASKIKHALGGVS